MTKNRKIIVLFVFINIVGILSVIYVLEHRELRTIYSAPCTTDQTVVWKKDAARSVLWDWLK